MTQLEEEVGKLQDVTEKKRSLILDQRFGMDDRYLRSFCSLKGGAEGIE